MDYNTFTTQLLDNLRADERVLGLVALGSMADAARRDRYSDHDFFVITQPGHQETFRQHLDWLPDFDSIVLQFRETAHGLKVMYADGHLLEFAVFDPDELMVARVNDYAVLYDTADIAERMADLVADSTPPERDYHKELLHALSLLQVGFGRYRRGEHLSGHMFVKCYALMHLLPVLAHYCPADAPDRRDNLDAFRRFEFAYPALGAAFNEALRSAPDETAMQLLALLETHLKPHMPDFPQVTVDALRGYFSG